MTTKDFLDNSHVVHVGGRYTVYIEEHYLLGFVHGAIMTVCDKQENVTYKSVGPVGTFSAISGKDYRNFPVAKFAKYIIKEAMKPKSETFRKYEGQHPIAFAGKLKRYIHKCKDTLKDEGGLFELVAFKKAVKTR